MRLMHFAVEGGGSAGLGHLRRSAVLGAEAQRHGFDVRFFVPDPASASPYLEEGIAISSLAEDREEVARATVVVADGYGIPPELGEVARGAGALVVRIDDNAETVWHPRIVLNHNVHAESVDYSSWGADQLLLGLRYALVDPALARLASRLRLSRRALVSFGGSDDGSRAAPVAIALARAGVEVRCVVAPHQEPSPLLIQALETPGVSIARGADMVIEASRASVYVGSAGVTALEMAAAGLSLVLCAIAPNQLAAASAFQTLGARLVDAEDPEMMAAAAVHALDVGRESGRAPLIDGEGAARVLAHVQTMLQRVDR